MMSQQSGCRLGQREIDPDAEHRDHPAAGPLAQRCRRLRLDQPGPGDEERHRRQRVESGPGGFGAHLRPKPPSPHEPADRMGAAAGGSVGANELGNGSEALPDRSAVIDRRGRELVVGADTDVENAVSRAARGPTHARHFEAVHLAEPDSMIGDDVEAGLSEQGDLVRARIGPRYQGLGGRDMVEGALLGAPDPRLGVREPGGLVGRQLASGIDDQVDGIQSGPPGPGNGGAERASTRFRQVDPTGVTLAKSGAAAERLGIADLMLGVFGDESPKLDGRQLGGPLGVQLSSVSVEACFLRRDP